MHLMTWDPFRDLHLLQGDVNRLFERAGAQGGAARRWMPALDVHEHEGHFEIRCDLPGVREQDIEVEVEDRALRIAGERRNEHADRREGFSRIERSFGRFERVLNLPEGVNAEAIEASFEHGVLELRVPKPEQSQPRRIQVTTKGQSTIDASTTVPDDASSLTDDRELANA